VNIPYYLPLHPIPKPFAKNGKEDVFKVIPHIEVVNHLGIGFCQELRYGYDNTFISN
jgi:hypothetical protein